MVWYDELYSTVRIPDVLKALNKLGNSATLSQIEKKITEIYDLPKGMLRDKDGNRITEEPLETLINMGYVKPVKYKNTIRYELKPDWREILFS